MFRDVTRVFFPAGCAAGSKGCRFPGAPAHSSVFFSDDSLGPETVATYSCERGFELLGPARRVCGRDGVWTPEGIPFCGECYYDIAFCIGRLGIPLSEVPLIYTTLWELAVFPSSSNLFNCTNRVLPLFLY